LDTEALSLINGGLEDPRGDDYNRVLGIVLWPLYDIGWVEFKSYIRSGKNKFKLLKSFRT